MGIQDIIDNGEQDISINDSLNDEIVEEDDFPVIYSDTSSDTASVNSFVDDFMPLFNEEENLNFDEDANWSNDSENFTDYSENFVEVDPYRNDLGVVVIINWDPSQQRESPQQNNQSNDNDDGEKSSTNLFKKIRNISAKNKSNMGKRKARRFENARQLDLLTSDTCSEAVDVDDFMPFNCTFRFTQILEDTDLTNKILNPSLNVNDNIPKKANPNKRKNSSGEKDSNKKMTASTAFSNLDSSERSFFKRRNLPMGMVHYLDSCVYSFFESDPTGTFVSEPLSSYERMMLHGIAHYYRLNSFSYNLENQDVRLTKVINNHTYFNPPCLCLSQYLEQEVHKTVNKIEHAEKRRRFRRQHCIKSR